MVELRDCERVMETTFYKTPKDDPKDRLEVIIGDDKQADFYPQLKIQRWDNEANVSIRLKDDDYSKATVEQVGDKVKWISDKREAYFYETPEGSEFEVILKEKPTSNVVEFTLVDKDVEYYYQPTIISHIDGIRIITATDTRGFDKNGNIVEEQPSNVVGSYAIYASEQKINWTGKKEYKCGKIGHIYRPKITDSAGISVWGELNVNTETGILSVTIPQDFLDKAVYPVRHAAGLTFGYTTEGAGLVAMDHDYIEGPIYNLPGDGTATKISAYVKDSASQSIQFGIYDDSSPTVRKANTGTGAMSTTITLVELDVTVGGSLTSGDHYLVANNNSTGSRYFAKDSGATEYYKAQAYGTWPATITGWGTIGDYKCSIYATYTAAGSAAAAASTMNMMGV